MTPKELCTWNCFCKLVTGVFGKNICDDWKQRIDTFIKALFDLGAKRMTSKMHLIFKHKGQFSKYLGKFSDEHGERLHQDMLAIENRFGSSLNKEMLCECIWSLKREENLIKIERIVFK